MNKNKQGVTEEQFKIADSNGISRRAVLIRVSRYWSIEEAITKPLTKKHDDIHPGLYYLAWMRGIGKERVNHRINILKWSPWDAATTPIGAKPKRPKPDV